MNIDLTPLTTPCTAFAFFVGIGVVLGFLTGAIRIHIGK